MFSFHARRLVAVIAALLAVSPPWAMGADVAKAKKVNKRRPADPVVLTAPNERLTAPEKEWFKQIKQWQGWLSGDRLERQSSALSKLKAIREPEAVPALAHFFRDVPDEVQRLMYVEILAQFKGNKPVVPLAVQSVLDESPAVRDAALGGVRGKDASGAIPVYLRALKHSQNAVVNRAGASLGLIGNKRNVPQLIQALVTRHEYQELVLEQNEFT